MKQLWLSLMGSLTIFLLCSAAGCNHNKKTGPEPIVKTGGEFPKHLAGTWKANAAKWQLTLAPDGNVVSLVNAAGLKMTMAEGGLFQPGPAEGTFLYFVFGPTHTNYHPKTRQLNVTVIIDRFHMKLPGGELQGDIKYYFTGPVSEDSQRWDVKLYSYATPKGLKPTDPNLVKPEIFVFTKVQNHQLSPPENQ